MPSDRFKLLDAGQSKKQGIITSVIMCSIHWEPGDGSNTSWQLLHIQHLLNWSRQPTRAYFAMKEILPKWRPFRELRASTQLQSNNPSSPNSAKFPFYKPCIQCFTKTTKIVTVFSMVVAG
jgi:hypothetical protein